MNEETHNSTIESELEARIVALVLGEASDFETEELNRLIALRPELAAFQQEMQQVHGLMQTLGAGEQETPDANWKLSAERRESVLAVIRGEAATVEDGALLAGVETGHVALRAESPTRPLPGSCSLQPGEEAASPPRPSPWPPRCGPAAAATRPLPGPCIMQPSAGPAPPARPSPWLPLA